MIDKLDYLFYWMKCNLLLDPYPHPKIWGPDIAKNIRVCKKFWVTVSAVFFQPCGSSSSIIERSIWVFQLWISIVNFFEIVLKAMAQAYYINVFTISLLPPQQCISSLNPLNKMDWKSFNTSIEKMPTISSKKLYSLLSYHINFLSNTDE